MWLLSADPAVATAEAGKPRTNSVPAPCDCGIGLSHSQADIANAWALSQSTSYPHDYSPVLCPKMPSIFEIGMSETFRLVSHLFCARCALSDMPFKADLEISI